MDQLEKPTQKPLYFVQGDANRGYVALKESLKYGHPNPVFIFAGDSLLGREYQTRASSVRNGVQTQIIFKRKHDKNHPSDFSPAIFTSQMGSEVFGNTFYAMGLLEEVIEKEKPERLFTIINKSLFNFEGDILDDLSHDIRRKADLPRFEKIKVKEEKPQ